VRVRSLIVNSSAMPQARKVSTNQTPRPKTGGRSASRNATTQQSSTKNLGQPTVEQSEEPSEKGRECLPLLAGVYALQLLVGQGPGRDQLLKELPRLFPHYDAAVRQAVVETMQITCLYGHDTALGKDSEGVRLALRVALPLLKAESWEAREVALQVVAGSAEASEKECIAPLVAALADSSWIVRHEAVVSIIQFYETCTDPEAFRPLIKAAAWSEPIGQRLDGPDGLLKRHEGEPFALALDALRVISERDDHLRGTIVGMLKAEVRLMPGVVQCPQGICKGAWLLQQPVSAGVAILLESKKAQRDAFRRAYSEIASFKLPDSGDIFSKAFRKFQLAADAETFPESRFKSNEDPEDLLTEEPASAGDQEEPQEKEVAVPAEAMVDTTRKAATTDAVEASMMANDSTALLDQGDAEQVLVLSAPGYSRSTSPEATHPLCGSISQDAAHFASASATKLAGLPRLPSS